MAICFSAYCKATAVLFHLKISAQQQTYTPQYEGGTSFDSSTKTFSLTFISSE
jgi:hypothetical protein